MIFIQSAESFSLSVSILIGDSYHAIFLNGQVLPVPRAVAIAIRNPLLSGKVFAIPGSSLFDS